LDQYLTEPLFILTVASSILTNCLSTVKRCVDQIFVVKSHPNMTEVGEKKEMNAITRASQIYCSGHVFHAFQKLHLMNDCKSFVDMPMKADPEEILRAFQQEISNPLDKKEMQVFLEKYFDQVGSDLKEWIPTDLKTSPSFLTRIQKKEYHQWAIELNQLWLSLGREVKETVLTHPQRTSLLPRQYPMIVPGGRFRESYYWDSWWIIRGLLVCEMFTTAKYIILNFLNDIQRYGFVPNGGRIYYLDRSQPPLLSEMVKSWLDVMGWSSSEGMEMVEMGYPLLQQEYDWWMSEENHHSVEITDPSDSTKSYSFNRYYSQETTPRPESYLYDLETAGINLAEENGESVDTITAATATHETLFRNIRSAAESGWDFSSRWIRPKVTVANDGSLEFQHPLSTINTTNIIPVELNSFMYRFELNLAAMAKHLGRVEDEERYLKAAISRKEGINRILWDRDYYR
jgi:alpha,alpha-trehalase